MTEKNTWKNGIAIMNKNDTIEKSMGTIRYIFNKNEIKWGWHMKEINQTNDIMRARGENKKQHKYKYINIEIEMDKRKSK